MKKLITSLIFVHVFSPFVIPQLDSHYCFNEPNSSHSILSFYNNGLYELISESTCDDQILTVLLSHGNYIMRDKRIFLSDSFNGYQMVFEISNQSIHSTKSLKYLKNKDFITCGRSHQHFPISTDNINSSYKDELLIRKLMWPVKIPLKTGVYVGSDDFKLYLDTISYKLLFQDLELSSGTWKIENNELKFSDQSLNHDFNGLIIHNGVKIYFLPLENGQLFFSESYLRNRTIPNKELWEFKVKN